MEKTQTENTQTENTDRKHREKTQRENTERKQRKHRQKTPRAAFPISFLTPCGKPCWSTRTQRCGASRTWRLRCAASSGHPGRAAPERPLRPGWCWACRLAAGALLCWAQSEDGLGLCELHHPAQDAERKPELVTGFTGPHVDGRGRGVPSTMALGGCGADFSAERRRRTEKRGKKNQGTLRIGKDKPVILNSG